MLLRLICAAVLTLSASCRLFVDADQFADDGDGQVDGGEGGAADGGAAADAGGAADGGATPPDGAPRDGDLFACDVLPAMFDPSGRRTQGDIVLSLADTYDVVLTGDPRIVDSGGEVVAELDLVTQVGDGRQALLLLVDNLVLGPGVRLRAQTAALAPPLLIVARTEIVVRGEIDVSSTSEAIGMGADDGCPGGPGTIDILLPGAGGGGGGGGFGGLAGDGGDVGLVDGLAGRGGTGGAPLQLEPDVLRGGCSGGDGAVVSDNPVGRGGRGGGAVHLFACEQIVIANSAAFYALGQGGGGGTPDPNSVRNGGGGGGGSGGYLGLESPAVTFTDPGAVLMADGGGGGGGGDDDGSGEPGSDAGKAGSNDSGGGKGGDGARGDGDGDGGDGGDADDSSALALDAADGAGAQAGGGGGGSFGRILIRASNSQAVRDLRDAGDIIASPVPSVEDL